MVDTNVIIECWRIGAWRALAGGYAVETVEDCVTETQTGFQRRRPERRIDGTVLRQGLAAVHPIDALHLAGAILREPLVAFLDTGEQALWAHALTRTDAWLLCGPDKASLKVGVRLGFRERLVALKALLVDAGFRPKSLARAYTSRWLDETLAELVISEGRRKS